MAEKVAILLDSVDELLVQIIKEQEKQKEILEQLDKVTQPYKLILEKEFIQGKSLVTVASEMNYTYEYIRKANGTALKKFEEVTKSYWMAHINYDNIYNEIKDKPQIEISNPMWQGLKYPIKSKCFKCLLFYYI